MMGTLLGQLRAGWWDMGDPEQDPMEDTMASSLRVPTLGPGAHGAVAWGGGPCIAPGQETRAGR